MAAAVALAGCSDERKERAIPANPTTTVTRGASSSTTYVEPRFVDARQSYAASGDYQNGYQIGGIQEVDVDARTVEVDFIQFLSGDAATKAYQEDTGETDTPPNDYWVRNASKRLRTYPVLRSASITVNTLGGHGPAQHESIELGRLAELLRGTRGDADYRLPLGLTIEDGQITRIEQLYVP